MREEVKQYFIFTKKEKRAVIVLALLIVIVFVLPFFLKKSSVQADTDESEIALMMEFKNEYEKQLAESNAFHAQHQEKTAAQLFYFDPNKIGVEEWMKLGLSSRQAEVIERYKSKGGKFRRAEDIRKIFVISDEKKEELLPYVKIENEEQDATFYANDFGEQKSAKQYSLFSFDPNKIGIQEWQQLGLSAKQAQTIENYKAKGGKFRKPEDIRKIFVLSDEKKEELLPYVVIEDTKSEKNIQPAEAVKDEIKSSFTERQQIIVDVNLADSAEFERLYGIGPKLASRIVQYRESLGGFVAVSQIKEVFGLPDSTYQQIKQNLKISKVGIRKIPINTADYNALRQHPYTRQLAYRIVKYRDSNTQFKTKDHVCRVPEMTEDLCKKLQFYITLD